MVRLKLACMWAARLRHDGGAALAALPRRRGLPSTVGVTHGSVCHQPLESTHLPDEQVLCQGKRAAFETWACRAASGIVEPLPCNLLVQSSSSEGRWDFPKRPRLERASGRTLAGASLDRDKLLAEYEADVMASTSAAAFVSRLRTWAKVHKAWFDGSVALLPLTPAKVRALASVLKGGGYSSGMQYLYAARTVSRLLGFRSDEFVDFEFTRAERSLSRASGGPQRQSKPLPLQDVLEASTKIEPLVVGGPVCSRDVCIVAIWWLLREIEVAAARLGDAWLDHERRIATINLPCSKKDIAGIGKERSHGCACSGLQSVAGCPFHALERQIGSAMSMCCGMGGDVATFPLFPNSEGEHCDKAAMVSTIEAVAINAGLAVIRDGVRLFGGHSWRVEGAQLLSAAGVPENVVEVFGRWGGPTVRRYMAEAPLRKAPSIACDVLCGERRQAAQDLAVAQEQLASASASSSAGPASAGGVDLDALRKSVELLSGEVQQLKLHADSALGCSSEGKCYVENSLSGVVHQVLLGGNGIHCDLWRTRCGWRFGRRSFTFHGPHHETSEWCDTCFPDYAAALPSEALKGDEASGSGGTSGPGTHSSVRSK